MKISLITVCYNSSKTIEQTINSVLSQDYDDIEYIVIDGMSKDNTYEIINKYKSEIDIIVCEKDHGMYDAINKGIKLAKGEIIGILNSDDVFAKNDIISQVAKAFENNHSVEAIIGDISFVNNLGKQVRYYSSKKWRPSHFVWGFMPAHPTFYCKRQKFIDYGGYKIDFEIAADYELLIRFFKIKKITYQYLNLHMVKMNIGGKSTQGLKSTFKINKEIKRGLKENNLYTNYFMLYSKYIIKIFELI